ncbi:MAG: hypothetical protein BGO31_05400 [Bacteroidetes bacterium 43-16]|uniref:hypothetical protein n=1 Tax=uncultured Dysgonomonas sp. TaxID=206096 RepID=UPI000928577E|nr:hypothetical protein [uncultured Dysgonomonas sp.]OJV52268.1 MAG: hypothetical protein BGO31_05400 [Bacteroidetes bacterium 43-16]
METSQTIYIILGGSILFIAVPAILIRLFWLDFIEELNNTMGVEAGIYKEEQPEPTPSPEHLTKGKILHFHHNNDLSKVRDFFHEDHESLWENRMN